MNRMKTYLEEMFRTLPDTEEVRRARHELWQMMEDKYSELIADGMTEEEAVNQVISEFGNLDELSDELNLGDLMKTGSGYTQQTTAAYGSPSYEETADYSSTQQTADSQSSYDYNTVNYRTPTYSDPPKHSAAKIIAICASIGCAVILIIVITLVSLFSVAKYAPSDVADEITDEIQDELSSELGITPHVKHAGDLKKTISLDEFSSIQIEAEIADLVFRPGMNWQLSYRVSDKNYVPTAAVRDGVLTIKQSDPDSLHFKAVNNTITITYPSDALFTSLSITNNIGDIDLLEMTTTDVVISNNVGDLKLSKLISETADITINTGDVTMRDGDIKTLSVETNTGDVELSNMKQTDHAGMTLSSASNDIEIDGEEVESPYNREPNSSYDFTISTATGEVEINLD